MTSILQDPEENHGEPFDETNGREKNCLGRKKCVD